MAGQRLPKYGDFVKGLVLALLCETAVLTAVNAWRIACVETGRNTELATLTTMSVGLFVAGSNFASMIGTHFLQIKDDMKSIAETAFFLILSQSILAAAVCLTRGMEMNAAVSLACIAAAAAVYRFVPGKFPPDYVA